eukprot:GHRR01020481.1.p1 GENE.GHRR01020481.1~~GHRR01020481.1.p1  ORF type:complete len:155 (+),score=29.75 GHRR01020481.1:1112-1576(+)
MFNCLLHTHHIAAAGPGDLRQTCPHCHNSQADLCQHHTDADSNRSSCSPLAVPSNFVGKLLAATVMASGTRAGAIWQLSSALLPEATTTGMPTFNTKCCTAASMAFDHWPEGTPSDRLATAGFTAFSATQSSATATHTYKGRRSSKYPVSHIEM